MTLAVVPPQTDYLTPMTRAESDAVAAPQIDAAERHLNRIEHHASHWPIPDLDRLTGPLGMGGDVWIVAGATGGGKTAFVTSAIHRWLRGGKRVYVMPLETEPHRFRTILACLDLEIHPGEALSGMLKQYTDGADRRRALVAAVKAPSPLLHVSSQSMMTVKGLERGLMEAKRFGADVIVIDHIDHIAGGDGTNAQAESKRVCQGLLEMAKGNELLVVATSQLNMESMKGNDRLGRYSAPQLNHLWMPGVKSQISTGIIGVYRPMRLKGEMETDKEFAAALSKARAGTAEPQTMLQPNTMGVVAMKLRNAGQNEGKRIGLPFRVGGIREVSDDPRD